MLLIDICHYNYKKHIVMLKVIVCVEANLFIMLHNDFEKYQM